MASPVNVAAPPVTVVAVALLSVAPAGPDAITAVTTRSAPPAGLPAPSRTWSTGCGLSGAPLVAVGDGSVVIVSWVAVPALSVIVPEVAGVRRHPAPGAPAAAPRPHHSWPSARARS